MRVSDHASKWRCRKRAWRCGAKHMSKSKSSKHHMFGPLVDVPMSLRVASARDSANFQECAKPDATTTTTPLPCTTLYTTTTWPRNNYSTLPYRNSLHDVTLHPTTLFYTRRNTLHYTTLHWTTTTTTMKNTLHFIKCSILHCSHYATLHSITLRYIRLDYNYNDKYKFNYNYITSTLG